MDLSLTAVGLALILGCGIGMADNRLWVIFCSVLAFVLGVVLSAA